jgi:hypothetical protein
MASYATALVPSWLNDVMASYANPKAQALLAKLADFSSAKPHFGLNQRSDPSQRQTMGGG